MTATAIDPHDFVNSLRNSLPAIHPALSDARRKRTGDALPKQVQAVIETGVALAKEAKGVRTRTVGMAPAAFFHLPREDERPRRTFWVLPGPPTF